MSRLKKVSYHIPVEGRIVMGERYDDDKGRAQFEKFSYFLIAELHKDHGRVVAHPVTKQVMRSTRAASAQKITEIPVKLMFNNPDLVLRERFEAYSPDRRIVCSGNGESAKRQVAGNIVDVPCPTNRCCSFMHCEQITRLNVQIDVPGNEEYQPDWTSSFLLTSAGYNTGTTLRAKLDAISAGVGGLIGVPFRLKIREKSSEVSNGESFYYADLEPSVSLVDAAELHKKIKSEMDVAGWNQAEYEAKILSGINNGPFGDGASDPEDVAHLIDFKANAGASLKSVPKAVDTSKSVDGVATEHILLDWIGGIRSDAQALRSKAGSKD